MSTMIDRGRRDFLELVQRVAITLPGLVRHIKGRPWLGHGHQRDRRIDLFRQFKTVGQRPTRELGSVSRY